jgi:hypothetical protein
VLEVLWYTVPQTTWKTVWISGFHLVINLCELNKPSMLKPVAQHSRRPLHVDHGRDRKPH